MSKILELLKKIGFGRSTTENHRTPINDEGNGTVLVNNSKKLAKELPGRENTDKGEGSELKPSAAQKTACQGQPQPGFTEIAD